MSIPLISPPVRVAVLGRNQDVQIEGARFRWNRRSLGYDGNQTHSSREKETSMRNTFSLHEVRIARFSGLLVLAFVAIAFFVSPIAMAAMGGKGGCAASNIVNKTPNLSNTIKVYFLGRVAGATGANLSATETKIAAAVDENLKPSDVATWSWFMCAVKAPNNTFTIFTCSVSAFNSKNKLTASDVTSNNGTLGVVLGLPTNVSQASPAVMAYVGKKTPLIYTLNAAGLVTTPPDVMQALQAAGTGWNMH